ncbi:unnamed protein product, partial [Amoebophrya sp. A25]
VDYVITWVPILFGHVADLKDKAEEMDIAKTMAAFHSNANAGSSSSATRPSPPVEMTSSSTSTSSSGSFSYFGDIAAKRHRASNQEKRAQRKEQQPHYRFPRHIKDTLVDLVLPLLSLKAA